MRLRALVPVTVVVLLLAGCTPERGEPAPAPTASTPTPSTSVDPLTLGPVQPVGDPVVIATGLNAPWSIVRLESGSTLISERDTAVVKEVQADGTIRDVGTVPGVVPAGEGGLLGLEYVEDDGPWLYTYYTAANDNRIVRFALDGSAGSYALGASEEILTGMAKAGNHNGGRIKLGPDGMLYATVGDAANTANSQNTASLNGKILRMTLEGGIPNDNPTPGSHVYSMGHRNPQGITWDRSGNLWAAEFGQDTWDELNAIQPGGNYGWPAVEGVGSDPAFINPVQQWSTDDASPSGLVWTRDTLFLAGLGGERLWAIYPAADGTVTAFEWFTGQFGRIRDVVAGPDGSLWMITNNTDGRGDPRDGDDKLIQVNLGTMQEG